IYTYTYQLTVTYSYLCLKGLRRGKSAMGCPNLVTSPLLLRLWWIRLGAATLSLFKSNISDPREDCEHMDTLSASLSASVSSRSCCTPLLLPPISRCVVAGTLEIKSPETCFGPSPQSAR
ncbi:unnamed protein product, partial [Meganyctiphanes norvegica]